MTLRIFLLLTILLHTYALTPISSDVLKRSDKECSTWKKYGPHCKTPKNAKMKQACYYIYVKMHMFCFTQPTMTQCNYWATRLPKCGQRKQRCSRIKGKLGLCPPKETRQSICVKYQGISDEGCKKGRAGEKLCQLTKQKAMYMCS